MIWDILDSNPGSAPVHSFATWKAGPISPKGIGSGCLVKPPHGLCLHGFVGRGDAPEMDASGAVGPEHVAEEEQPLSFDESATNTKNAHNMHQQVSAER